MANETNAKRKRSLLPLSISLALFLAGGLGSFFAIERKWFSKIENKHNAQESPTASFVPLDPLIISYSENGALRHLRFAAQIEVLQGNEKVVERLRPRIIDVLNTYLRALELRDLEKPNAFLLLRIQIAYRIKLIVGEENVRDLLITEFVLS